MSPAGHHNPVRFGYNSSTNATDYDHQEHYLLLTDDVDQYFGKINLLPNVSEAPVYIQHQLNCTLFGNGTNGTCSATGLGDHYRNYLALVLLIVPILTVYGNVLVILSVYRERTLQTATNYFIVSLALADLLVAVVVMPFAVYVLVNGRWDLPAMVCDFYIAMDVTCSTSSIFNLVAISIDRFIAVTQPIKYAKHKNNRRIWLTIVLVWVISAAIGSPIVLGLNNTPDRVDDVCMFFNSDFIIFSSLSSFYIPCIIMVFLYYSIFKNMSFVVVEWMSGGVSLINKGWLTPMKKEAYWPPVKDQKAFIKELRKIDPQVNYEQWEPHAIKRCMYESCDYEKATAKLKQAEDTSNLESDEEVEKPRKRIKTKRYVNSSDDSDEELIVKKSLLQRSPPPKLFEFPKHSEDTCNISQRVENCNFREPPRPATPTKLLTSCIPPRTGLSTSVPELISQPSTSSSINSAIPLQTNVNLTPTLTSFEKKVIGLLTYIKSQNEEILKTLNPTTSDSLVCGGMPELPVEIPMKTKDDITSLEDFFRENGYSTLALKKRAMQQRAVRKPLPSEIKAGSVIENLATTRRLAETHLGATTIEEPATNTGSGSGDEDDEIVDAECQVISNDKSTEFILATVVEEAAISSVVASLATPNNLGDPNGNNDSGYAHSQADSLAPDSPKTLGSGRSIIKKNGASVDTELRTVAINSRTASVRSIGSKKEKKATAAARFTIYKVNKASRKKREKSSAKKERKATKTLAIVLGLFLICWVPFFTCNILDAMCSKLDLPCNPGVSAFLLTTWLGYMNSFVNPVIYTIFNPEFRKAFKKLMFMGP